MLSGVNVQQLQIFLMIVRAGSLTAAAQRLQMTPAAVSLSLRQLEQQWDCRCCCARHAVRS